MARRRQAVTIKHVAADAGVSLQTVSRVINSEPNVRPAMQGKGAGLNRQAGLCSVDRGSTDERIAVLPDPCD